jgi:DNA repair exonuclease SbcCD ATPase subunit
LSPKFDFFKRKTSDIFHEKKNRTDSVQKVTDKELLEIVEKEKKLIERDLIADLEPARKSVLECLDRLRTDADDLEKQEIKVENPQFESIINNSKTILITSIKKETFIESSEFKDYEDAVKFKNNLELLINRFGQVGDSHNRILNEFMHKQINKLKNEFDNLSSLLKEVTKIISAKESEINKSIVCRDDLILFKDKLNEIKGKQKRLSELTEEKGTIDRNIDASKAQYNDFKRSEEFLNIADNLQKIKDRKNEMLMFEKNMINMISNLSRPITKFSYLASRETQVRLAMLQNKPLEIFNDVSQYIQLFGELRKDVIEKKIQIKDPRKTIHQIDEIVDSLPSLSSNLKNLKEDLARLESSVNPKNIRHLEEMKYKTEMFEKYRSENIATIELTKTNINELDSAIESLKKKIEDDIFEVTNTRYFILRDQN